LPNAKFGIGYVMRISFLMRIFSENPLLSEKPRTPAFENAFARQRRRVPIYPNFPSHLLQRSIAAKPLAAMPALASPTAKFCNRGRTHALSVRAAVAILNHTD
jgi:hypothetical protein